MAALAAGGVLGGAVVIPSAGAIPADGTVGLGPGGSTGSAWITADVEPGTTWDGSVVVSNPSRSGVRILLYPADGLTSPATGLAFSDRGDPLRAPSAVHAEGSWLSLPVGTLTLAAGQSVHLPFSVSVPVGAVPGDHVAAIVAEDASTDERTARNVSITVVSRVAMAVVVVVPGPAAAALTLGRPVLRASGVDHLATLLLPITDVGLLFTEPDLTVMLTGPGTHQVVRRTLQVILPGDTVDLALPWPDSLPVASYTVRATLRWPGGADSLTDGLRTAAPLTGTPELAPHTRLVLRQVATTPVLLEVAAGVGVGVLALALAAFVWLWRRREARPSSTVAP